MSNINNGEFSNFIESLNLKKTYNSERNSLLYTKNSENFTYEGLKQNIAIKKAFYLYKFENLLSALTKIDDSYKKVLIEEFKKNSSPGEAFLQLQYKNAIYINKLGSVKDIQDTPPAPPTPPKSTKSSNDKQFAKYITKNFNTEIISNGFMYRNKKNNILVPLSTVKEMYEKYVQYTNRNQNPNFERVLKNSRESQEQQEAEDTYIRESCKTIDKLVKSQKIDITNNKLPQLVSEIITLCIQHKILKQNDFEMIEADDKHPIIYRDIPYFDTPEVHNIFKKVIKIKTSGSNNDCLIHSILTSISSQYRTLDGIGKKIIASYFRRYIFSILDGIDEGFMNSIQFLTDVEAEIISKYYKLNIMILVNTSQYAAKHFRFFENNPLTYYLILHNNGGSHYSAVYLNDKYTLEYRLGNELKEKYGEEASGNEILRCKFVDGNKIQLKDTRKQFLVISRKFDDISSYGGIKECVSITVNEKNTAGSPITINASDFYKYDIIRSGGSRKNKKKSIKKTIKKTILKKSKKGKCKK